MTKIIGMISDTHVGSTDGICTDEVKLDDNGGYYTASKEQKHLCRNLERFADQVGKMDMLVINGDCCEGINRKGEGLGNWTNDGDIQSKTAADLYRYFKAKQYLVIQGSKYHTKDNVSWDHLVANELKGKFELDHKLTVDKTTFHLRHKVGTTQSGWQYRTTPVAKDMMLAVLAEPEFGKTNVVIRGHAHYFVGVEFAHSAGYILPCWKGRDEFAKLNLPVSAPANGGLVFYVEPDGSFYMEKHMFTLPGKYLITETVL
jgi:hypothetical protein